MIQNNLLRLLLSCPDLDNHFNYKVNRALTMGGLRTFLENTEKVITKLRDKPRVNRSSSFVNSFVRVTLSIRNI